MNHQLSASNTYIHNAFWVISKSGGKSPYFTLCYFKANAMKTKTYTRAHLQQLNTSFYECVCTLIYFTKTYSAVLFEWTRECRTLRSETVLRDAVLIRCDEIFENNQIVLVHTCTFVGCMYAQWDRCVHAGVHTLLFMQTKPIYLINVTF